MVNLLQIEADKIHQYPPVRDAQPNPTHIYIAALLHLGLAPNLITQNVCKAVCLTIERV